MAVAFVKNVGSAAWSRTTSSVINVPAGGVAAGNTLVIRVSMEDGFTPSISDSQGNTYTGRGYSPGAWNSGAAEMWAFDGVISTALTSSDTITLTVGKSVGGWVVDEFSGVGAYDNAAAMVSGQDAMPYSASLTPAGAGLVIGFHCYGDATDRLSVEDWDTVGGGSWVTLTRVAETGRSANGAYKITTSAASQTYNLALTTQEVWGCGILAWNAGAVTDDFTANAAIKKTQSSSATADAAIAVSTSVAKVSLQPMPFPDPQTDHVIRVRARCTTGSGNSLGVALYEGANNRSGNLTQTLTNTLADYEIAISDAAAATITSYEDLEIWWWGVAVSGSTTFEVDYIGLSIPSGTRTTSFAADAVIDDGGGAVTDDFTANATIKKAQSSSTTADAVIEKSQSGSLTADATAGKTTSESLAADAVVKGTRSDSATADAIVFAAGTGSFTVDAIRGATFASSADADAIVLATVSGSLSADAVVWKSVEWSLTADAAIARSATGSFVASAFIESVATDSFTADADIFATVSGSLTAGAWLAGTFTADATVRATTESTFTASAWVAGSGVGAFPADAIIFAAGTGSFTVDAIRGISGSGSLSADAVISSTASGALFADAIVSETASGSLTADAAFLRQASDSFSANAVIDLVSRCIWTTPADGVQMSATPTLAFLMPEAAAGDMHFQIEIDTDSGYSSPTVWTSTDPTGWEYWDGADWQPVPQAGVSNTYCGNEARYTVQSALPNDTYYRRVRAGVI